LAEKRKKILIFPKTRKKKRQTEMHSPRHIWCSRKTLWRVDIYTVTFFLRQENIFGGNLAKTKLTILRAGTSQKEFFE
jgi:hypothetical protein